jgi:hypothetical protein
MNHNTELESARKDQKKIGKTESKPQDPGPNALEEAAEMTDQTQDMSYAS